MSTASAISQWSLSAIELGKYAEQAAQKINTWGWDRFFLHTQQPKCLSFNLTAWPHSAQSQLAQLHRNGAPAVNQSPPWSRRRKDAAVKRGSHISARMQFREFLETEMVDMVRRGYWVVVPYHVIRHLPGLKISPLVSSPNALVAREPSLTTPSRV